MSGYKQVMLPALVDNNGALIGFKEQDGDETMIPRFSNDMTALLKPDGTALAGHGAGYTLPVATSSTLGGVKAGTGVSIGGDGTLSATAVGGAAAIVGTATSDVALPARSLIYIKSNGNCALADATAEGKEAIGFVQTAVAAGAVATFSMIGSLMTGLTGLAPGVWYYMGMAGNIVTLANAPTSTGNVLMKIGTAISGTALLFAPEPPITL